VECQKNTHCFPSYSSQAPDRALGLWVEMQDWYEGRCYDGRHRHTHVSKWSFGGL